VQDRGSNRAYKADKMEGFREYYINHFWIVWLEE
jgi:hypothetical protein